MATEDKAERRLVNAAALGAMVMIAQQVASKATRDAIFLSTFDVAYLPTMIVGSAFLSFIAAVVASRFMSRYGPDKLIPLTFLTSALLNLCEWGGLQIA
ncbi:MAG: hypothetical protein ACI9MR_005162, partial [Myxococcota bacterium]